MPMTAEMRRDVDVIRVTLYGGGYPDPLTNAEQLAFLFFFYLVEGIDRDNALRARAAKRPYTSLFDGDWTIQNPLNAPAKEVTTIPREKLRWSAWARGLSGTTLVTFTRDEVFPFYADVATRSSFNFMDGARLVVDDPSVLTTMVRLVDNLRLEQADADTKGDLFEYVLKKAATQGELGQFRTARHVIRAMVAMIDPHLGESVYDPACGTAGFLAAAYDHIRFANSSPELVEEVDLDGKRLRRGHADRLSTEQARQLADRTFFGEDVDPKMARLATMNLFLRGLENARIQRRNALTTTFGREERAERGFPAEGFDVILANPPFSGRVDRDRVVEEVKVGNTGQTELLFLRYMLEVLVPGGRCGVVVPEGVLFGSTTAHREIRRMLLEQNRMEAVLSLPGGVFQPYAGVKTSVLIFRKGGGPTGPVLFLHAEADGYKLDAQHDTPIDADDLPGAVAAFHGREALWRRWHARDTAVEWNEKWWFADLAAIRAADFNLAAGRHRPLSVAQAEHSDPLELLDELAVLDAEMASEMATLREKVAELVG